MTKKRIYLNAFEMVCAGGHQSPGLWLHEDDRSHTYKDSEYWIELAKLLEKGKFDAVFLADVLGTYDVYGGTRDAALRNAVQTPVNDPLLVVPLMSSVTEHLSFGVTASVSHEHPYTFARRICYGSPRKAAQSRPAQSRIRGARIERQAAQQSWDPEKRKMTGSAAPPARGPPRAPAP